MSGWIPIKEKEPDTCDHVLVVFDWGDGDLEVSELDYAMTKYMAKEGDKYNIKMLEAVIAWQYMPEPYREEQEDV